MKSVLILLLIALSLQTTLSQNLVLNPSFERFECHGWRISSIELCANWMTPSYETPDYFTNACAEDKTVPIPDRHWWGPQLPKTGNAYMGIIAYRPDNGQYEKPIREHIEGTLSQPLKKGVRYTVKFNVSLAECSRMSLKNLDLCFSEKKIKGKTLPALQPDYQVTFLSSGADTANWTTLIETYIAKGNERYFIIGCLDYSRKVKYKKVSTTKAIQGPRKEAYYFIDDVSIVEEGRDDYEPPVEQPVITKSSADTVKPSLPPAPLKIGVPIILKHIFFETGESKLLSSSFLALDSLVIILKTQPDTQIKINGYTDNVGSEENNLALSLNRSKAVFDYLVANGIDSVRLTYAGYGDKNPVATNTTDAGREQNRRVEFILFKKDE